MFSKCDFKVLELNDNSIYIGIVKLNDSLLKKANIMQPIIRDTSFKQIKKVDKKNYATYDEFIITSLNDYYNRMSSASQKDREMMLINYNRLYESWTKLNQAKSTQDFKDLDEQYDSLSYQLYLLGYKMSNN